MTPRVTGQLRGPAARRRIRTGLAQKEQWQERNRADRNVGPAPRLTASRAMPRVRPRRAKLPPNMASHEQKSMTDTRKLEPLLERVAAALDRLAPPPPPDNDLDLADAFVWHAERGWLEPVASVHRGALEA